MALHAPKKSFVDLIGPLLYTHTCAHTTKHKHTQCENPLKQTMTAAG